MELYLVLGFKIIKIRYEDFMKIKHVKFQVERTWCYNQLRLVVVNNKGGVHIWELKKFPKTKYWF